MERKILVNFKEKIGEMDSRIIVDGEELILEVKLDTGGPGDWVLNKLESGEEINLSECPYPEIKITPAELIEFEPGEGKRGPDWERLEREYLEGRVKND